MLGALAVSMALFVAYLGLAPLTSASINPGTATTTHSRTQVTHRERCSRFGEQISWTHSIGSDDSLNSISTALPPATTLSSSCHSSDSSLAAAAMTR